MASEETPLLATENRRDDVYLRFSSVRKNVILMMVSGCGLINMFVVGTFTPSIPQIAKDLKSTGAIVNMAVSISVLAMSLGGLIAASYSTFYGRRPVYLYTLPILFIGSIGVAAAQSIPSLLFWRFFQSMGGSPGAVLGAGVIGDIFKLEERGRAMGVFFAACLIGPSVAPFAGGWTTQYYSWRVMQGSLGLVALIAFILVYFFFPETSQPGARGIDKINATNDGLDSSSPFIFINPLQSLWLLRSPSMLLVGIALSTAMISLFVLLVPMAYTFGVRYHITSDALIGACFIPAGLGNMVGAIIVGRISDYTVIRWRKKRGGIWFPEDRLRAALIPFATIVPISILAFGLVNKFVDGTLGLVLSLVCLFFNGVGVDMCFGPCVAYLVDVMHSRSAESLAANGALRSALVAIAVAGALPMIDAYGIVITNLICAILVWISFGIMCCIIKYGEQMRAWIDIGFSTVENN